MNSISLADPAEDFSRMRIKNLIYYPIKSCKGIEIDSAHVDPRGLENDRRLMIIDASGGSVTQREIPKLSVVEPMIVDRKMLTLAAPGMSPLQLEMIDAGDERVRAGLEPTIRGCRSRRRCSGLAIGIFGAAGTTGADR